MWINDLPTKMNPKSKSPMNKWVHILRWKNIETSEMDFQSFN